jgi:hypothetical protein
MGRRRRHVRKTTRYDLRVIVGRLLDEITFVPINPLHHPSSILRECEHLRIRAKIISESSLQNVAALIVAVK